MIETDLTATKEFVFQSSQGQDTLRQLTVLYQASLAINRAHSEEEVVEALVKQLSYGEFDRGMVVILRDRKEPRGKVCGYWNRSKTASAPKGWIKSSTFGPETNITNDIANNRSLWPAICKQYVEMGIFSAAQVPIMGQSKLLGMLVLETRNEIHLSPEHIHPYQVLAAQAATALENQGLLAAEQQRSEELGSLVAISQTFAPITDRRQTFGELTSRIAEALGAERCLVALYHPETKEIVGQAPAFGVTDQVAETFRYAADGKLREQWNLKERGPFISNDPSEDIDQALQGLVDSFDIQSMMVVPMLSEDKVIGMIFAANKPNGFDPRDAQLATVFASQAANIIRNTQIYEEQQRRAQEMQVLNQIAATVSSSLAMDEILQQTMEQLAQVLEIDMGLVALWDQNQANMSLAATYQMPAEFEELLRDKGMDDTLCAITARQGQVYREADISKVTEVPTKGLVDLGYRAYLGAPLLAEGQVLGTLCAFNQNPDHFTEDNANVFAAAGTQVGLALRNALRFEETQQRARQVQTAGEITRAALAEQDPQQLIQSTVDLIRYRFGYYHVSIFIVDEAREWAVVRASTGDVGQKMIEMPHKLEVDGQSIVGAVAATGKAHIALDVGKDAVYFDNPLLPQTHSEMALPLIDRDKVLGVLDVQSTQTNAFTPNDITILQTMTDQIAIALRNTQLLDQVETEAARAKARASQSAILLQVVQRVQTEEDLKKQIQLIADGVAEAKLFHQAVLSVLDEDWQTLQEYSGYSGLTEKEIAYLESTTPPGRTERQQQFQDRFRVGNSYYIPAGEDPAMDQEGELIQRDESLTEWHPNDKLMVPLWMEDKLVGVFNLDDPFDGCVPTEESLVPMELFANLAAWVIENSQLLNDAQQRTIQLQTAAEISRAAGSVLNLDMLYTETLELIAERFGFSYVGLFLVDEAHRWAILQAGTGEAGQMMVQAGHRLEVGGKSMIGQSIAVGQAKIAQDVGMATSYFANPYLKTQTRSEMALPLIARGKAIGAISVQSPSEGAFGQQDITILQTIADQFANTISNATLFEQLQESLSDSEQVYRRYIRQEWDVHALAKSSEERSGYEYDLMQVRPTDRIGIPEAGGAEPADDLLTSPLVLAGEVIGSIGVTAESKDYEWTEDEIAIITSVAEQVTQAMESAYHSEQSERRAAQLSAAAEVGQSISSVLTADEVMQAAVNKLSELFGLYHAAIYLIDDASGVIALQEASGHAGEVMQQSNYYLQSDDKSLITQAIEERQTCIGLDVDQAQAWQQNPLLPDTRSEMAIPLIAAGQVLGALNVHTIQAAAYDQVDATVFQTIADQIASTLENARLFEETRQSAADQQMLFEVTTAAVTTAEMDDMLQRVADSICSRMEGTNVGILMIDQEEQVLKAQAAAGFDELPDEYKQVPLGQGVTGWVALTGKPVILSNVNDSAHYIVGDTRTQSELAVPITVDQQVAGVINIESHELDAFDDNDLRLLQTLSGTLGAIVKSFTLVSELQAANQLLQEVDKLKSQFLANMSHELRTPLNSIIGFSRVILKGIDGPITDLQKQDLTSIHNSGRHLLNLINDVLDHSKIEAGAMEIDQEATSVAETINSVMAMAVGFTKDKSIDLRQEVPSQVPIVWADPFRLRQVLINLVNNASKFTDEGSITTKVTYDDDAVYISVIDTGTGISEEDKDKLFKAFSQVDASSTRKVGGSGLGLSISAHLMQMQGGQIWVDSELGVGSTFGVAVPRINLAGTGAIRDLNVDAAAEPAAAQVVEPTESKLVLSIDDEQGVIDLFRRYLSREGYQVEGVTSGVAAVGRAVELADQLVAITVDILMPDMNGWEIVHQLRSNPTTDRIPIIICSIKLDQALAKEYNVEHYLVKPILQDDLLNAVREHDQDSE